MDEDADGYVDCEDQDCVESEYCLESSNCDDGIDNDLDGLEDCDDGDCVEDGYCTGESVENDYSEIISGCSLDGDCTGDNEVCVSFVCYTAECSDGIDNDDDGNIDLNDQGCDSATDNLEYGMDSSGGFAYAPGAESSGFFAKFWSWITFLFGGLE